MAHEFAEGALAGNANLGGEMGLVVTAVFRVDEVAILELELASVVGALVSVLTVFSNSNIRNQFSNDVYRLLEIIVVILERGA